MNRQEKANVCCVVLAIIMIASPRLSGQAPASLSAIPTGIASPQSPTVTVNIAASFQPSMYAFCEAGFFDITASDGALAIVDFPLGTAQGWIPPGTYGSTIGNKIIGTGAWQFHSPFPGPPASTANPVVIIVVEWTTTDFTPRSVDVSLTSLDFFGVYTSPTNYTPSYIDPALVELISGSITVIPAPATLAILVPALAVAGRRRRR